MKKPYKRVLSMFLTGGVLVSALTGSLAGCSAKKSANGVSDANFMSTGLPIEKKPITISILTMRWGDMGSTFESNTWLQNLSKTTNVNVNWEIKSSNDWSEQKSLLIASGKLPDVILGDQTFSSSDIVNNLGDFVALDSYIDKYMPNLKQALSEDSVLKKYATFPDGKIYSLPARAPSRPYSCDQLIINKTWLDKLHLKAPTNLDEFEAVLKAFKNDDPNGNGKKDEIPYSSKGLDANFIAAFGITDLNNTQMMIQDGKPVFYPISDQFKAGIAWMHKLYSEGLIDPETFTQDDTKLTGKFVNASAPIVGVSYQWTPDSVFGKWSSQYEAIAPLAGPDGKKYQTGDPATQSYRRNELEITKFCKHPEAVARWADQWYTGEASIQNFWGALGTVTKKNSDGTYSLLTPPAGTSADAWYWSSSLRDFGPKYASAEFCKKITLPTDSGDGEKLQIDKLGKDYVPAQFPDLMYTTQEFSDLSTLTTDITNYVSQMEAQWITKGGIDAQWSGYLSKLNDMGLSKLVKIRTDAYERYQKS